MKKIFKMNRKYELRWKKWWKMVKQLESNLADLYLPSRHAPYQHHVPGVRAARSDRQKTIERKGDDATHYFISIHHQLQKQKN